MESALYLIDGVIPETLNGATSYPLSSKATTCQQCLMLSSRKHFEVLTGPTLYAFKNVQEWNLCYSLGSASSPCINIF